MTDSSISLWAAVTTHEVTLRKPHRPSLLLDSPAGQIPCSWTPRLIQELLTAALLWIYFVPIITCISPAVNVSHMMAAIKRKKNAEIQTSAETQTQFNRLSFPHIFPFCLYWACWEIIAARRLVRHAFISIHSRAVNTWNHIRCDVSQTEDHIEAASLGLFVLQDFIWMFSPFYDFCFQSFHVGSSFRFQSF